MPKKQINWTHVNSWSIDIRKQTKSRHQKPKPTKQKLNRKNQNWIIIGENKNGNFKYLSIKKTKPRPDMENNKKIEKRKKMEKTK